MTHPSSREDRVPYAAAVVLAGGSGTRMGAGMNKAYLPLAGRPLVSYSLAAFGRVPEIGALVLVVRPEDHELVESVLDRESRVPVEVVAGGDTRQGSESRALRRLAGRVQDGVIDVVLLHDAARPLVGTELITAVLRAAREHGGAVPGLPAEDIVAVGGEGGTVVTGPPLQGAVRAQTPQGFRAGPLVDAYERAARDAFVGTDTASCMERYSDVAVWWVPGDEHNLKMTYPHDLAVAARFLATAG